jgi:hypothetical protein
MQDQHDGPESAHGDGVFSSTQWPWPWEQHGCLPRDSDRPAGMEPFWQAIQALQAVDSEELLAVLQHPTFRQMPGHVPVPVSPCRVCGDGALRTAGTLQTSLGQLLVRACDTCGLVDLDPRLITGH